MSYLAGETPVLRIAGRESWDVQGNCQRRGLFSCSSYSSSCRVHPGYEELWCHPGLHVSVVLDWQGFNVLEASRVDCFTNDQYGKFISTVHVWACHISQSLFIFLAAMTVNIFKCFSCHAVILLDWVSTDFPLPQTLLNEISCRELKFSIQPLKALSPVTLSFWPNSSAFVTSIGPGMGMFWSLAPLNNILQVLTSLKLPILVGFFLFGSNCVNAFSHLDSVFAGTPNS